ncbi:hypothetical protein TNCV_4448251 [Trichonephila clavipes]|nr:hypothetical protein TNCV_4448251 [Trichonephila clavipes]
MFRCNDDTLSGCHSGTTWTFVSRVPWVLNFCLWMTTPVPHRANIVDGVMPSIRGYHPYGLANILTGLESIRASVGYA